VAGGLVTSVGVCVGEVEVGLCSCGGVDEEDVVDTLVNESSSAMLATTPRMGPAPFEWDSRGSELRWLVILLF